MTLRAVFRWLSNQAICVATHVSPRERQEWARAMSREIDEISDDREALRWALGCLHISCHEKLKSMKLTNWWPVRWGMALWIALLAIDTLFYAGITLTYKFGLFSEQNHYPRNLPLLEVTPVWEPMLALIAGVIFLLATVLILRRSRGALWAAAAPFAIVVLLFAIRFSRPESGYLQTLSIAYHHTHFALIWPIAGLTITVMICLALWQDSQTPAPR